MKFFVRSLIEKTRFLTPSGLFLLLSMMAACTMGKTSEATADSLAIDSAAQAGTNTEGQGQTENSQGKNFAITNFPTFLSGTYTGEQDEEEAMSALLKLVARYDTARLFIIESNCKVDQEEEIGPGETVQSSQNENLKVFYDSYNNPVAAVWTESYTIDGSDKHYYNTGHYFFEKDNLTGFAVDEDVYLDANVKRYLRATASKCPTCGVQLSSGVQSAGLELSTLEEQAYLYAEEGILEKVNAQRNSIIGNALTLRDNLYYSITLSAIRPNGKSCPTDFYVDKFLFEKYYKELGD